jgi:predicted nucleic acid-binding protein
MRIEYSAMNREAALAAAESWFACRRRGGRRNRIAADFLIGGHARIQCEQLLTRASRFYKEHFEGLSVVSP